MTNTTRQTLSWTVSLLPLMVAAFLVFAKANGLVSNPAYYNLYIAGSLAAFTGLAAYTVIDFAAPKTLAGRFLYVFDLKQTRTRPVPPLIAGVLATLALTGLIAALSAGGLNYAPPNPYSTGSLSAETLSQKSALTNIGLVAVVPGVVEEAITFLLWTVPTTITLLVYAALTGRRPGAAQYYLTSIVFIFVAAALFSWGHSRYGGDQTAFIVAFVFETIVQLLNLFTAGFWSWLPHIAHNAGVTLQQTLSFTVASIIPVMPTTINLTSISERVKATWEG